MSSRSAGCSPSTERPIAPSTFYDAHHRIPARAERDERLKTDIARVHAANYGLYGARKVWLALNREGTPVARCTVERPATSLLERISRHAALLYGSPLDGSVDGPAAVSVRSR